MWVIMFNMTSPDTHRNSIHKLVLFIQTQFVHICCIVGWRVWIFKQLFLICQSKCEWMTPVYLWCQHHQGGFWDLKTTLDQESGLDSYYFPYRNSLWCPGLFTFSVNETLLPCQSLLIVPIIDCNQCHVNSPLVKPLSNDWCTKDKLATTEGKLSLSLQSTIATCTLLHFHFNMISILCFCSLRILFFNRKTCLIHEQWSLQCKQEVEGWSLIYYSDELQNAN